MWGLVQGLIYLEIKKRLMLNNKNCKRNQNCWFTLDQISDQIAAYFLHRAVDCLLPLFVREGEKMRGVKFYRGKADSTEDTPPAWAGAPAWRASFHFWAWQKHMA